MDRVREWLTWLGWRRVVLTVLATPAAVVVAWWMLRMPPPPVESLIPVAPATTAPSAESPTVGWLSPLDTLVPDRVTVHVVGAVVSPGVYRLEPGARADDALRAAGGPSRDADLRRVNLAAPVHDGEQLVIPRVGERLATTTTPRSSPGVTVPPLIDLNVASATDLQRLPGVGPATAKAIVEHRSRNGPFASVDDLLAVRGIGPAKLAEIRPWVRV